MVAPVTITVSQPAKVSSEWSGVPWKNEGRFFGSRTSPSRQRRSSTWAQCESGVHSTRKGSLCTHRPSSISPSQQTTVWKTGTPASRADREDACCRLDRAVDERRARERRRVIRVQVLEVDDEHGRPLAGLDPALPVALEDVRIVVPELHRPRLYRG